MINYIIRRLLLMIPTMFLISVICFFVVRFIPTDVIELMMAQMASESAGGTVDVVLMEADLKHKMGLDAPALTQYGRWIGVIPQEDGSFRGALEGDLGVSIWRGTSVTEELFQRLPVSLELGIWAILTGMSISIPIGINSAIRQDTMRDYSGRTLAILCISLPSFWLATIVTVYPSIWWGWSPPSEYIPIVDNLLGNLLQFMIPAIIMGMILSGTVMRMTRTMMLEVLRQDYIRTGWSKGLTERTIIFRHALKNALIPVITMIGMQMPVMISGTVVIETIFALPGVGRLLIDSLNKRDYPIISGVNMALTSFVLILNLLVDLAYGYLDPRIVYK